MTLRVRKGDKVAIIAGKDLGAEGRVLEVLPRKRKVIVEGVSRATRHEKIRMNQRGGQEGGISHKEAAIDISNVALVCPTDGPTRAGYRIDGSGAKARICKKCGTEL
ncbi:MAG: 50S ribosomal protein L24 [Actinomycetota bacterium]|nr:50S ribosomal protein L24 [Actinomycetota bacterium]MDQ5815455.1 50S ribosomal protein L24 [Actinomycetota bacterium]